MPSPARQAVRRFGSSRTWIQWLRMANFVGYDAVERYHAEIGERVHISPTASFRNGERIAIGAGSHIGQGSMLWAGDSNGRITLGSHVLLAPRVFITASNYDFDRGNGPVMDLPKAEADVTIGDDSWLGANVVVVAGVTIGDRAIIAAGAVVTANVAEGSVSGGVPARHIRYRGAS